MSAANPPSLLRLRSDRLSLDLRPSLGGSIVGFRWRHPDGATLQLMRSAGGAALSGDDVGDASCFPLTPFSNRLRDGRFTFDGSSIAMPLNVPDSPHVEHGHGWQRPWHVVEHASNSATLRYAHAPDSWPYAYEMRQSFLLLPDRLDIELATRNTGATAMPYGFGLHPYFPRTPGTTLTASVAGMWETDAEVMPTRHVPATGISDLGAGLVVGEHALDNCFTGWNGRAEIRWPECSAALSMAATWPLAFLVVYSPPGAEYFCAEPVSNVTDAFNLAAAGRTDTGMLTLETGATMRATLSLTPHVI